MAEAARLYNQAAADEALLESLHQVARITADSLRGGGTLYLCGNGGSAAEATHLAGEFVGAFYDRTRPALAAVPLGFDPATLTAVANDFDYQQVFSRQLSALGNAGDVLWALSTTGNSPNVVAAMRQARDMGIATVLLTNHDGGQARPLADHALLTPKADPPHVQELHLLYGHCLCEWIEAELTGKGATNQDHAALKR